MTVRVLVVHPRDLADPSGGGIQTFLRDFVAHAPVDFEISFAGVTTDAAARPVGQWQTVQVGSRQARFLPVARAGSLIRHPLRLPATLAALGTLRSEMRVPGAILQVHRPYRHVVFRNHHGPRVQIIHLDLDAWPGPSGWRRLTFLYRDFDDGLDRFDRVFIANEAGAARLRRDNPRIADRIAFLSGWYDDTVFRPLAEQERPQQRRRLAASLGVPADAVDDRWVLFVGRLDPIKDPDLAVDAFAELCQNSPRPVRLIVCGDGEERDQLMARAAERGVADVVHVVGDQPRNTVAGLMAVSDVLLVTSVAEGGGPRVVLEALGSGLPVVSTIVGEVRRSVVSGRTGWLTEDRMPDSLAAGLRWALDQPREQLTAATAEAARPFVVTSVLEQLYDAYRELSEETQAGG